MSIVSLSPFRMVNIGRRTLVNPRRRFTPYWREYAAPLRRSRLPTLVSASSPPPIDEVDNNVQRCASRCSERDK
jgi:hypothetical protein